MNYESTDYDESNASAQEPHDTTIPPPMPSEEKRMTREEMLTLENYYLKIQYNAGQARELEMRKQQHIAQAQEIEKELTAYRNTLSKKYELDLTKMVVGVDGLILERGFQQ